MRHNYFVTLVDQSRTIDTNHLIQYGRAQKPFDQLTTSELADVINRLQKKVRERAWAVGSPVYYGENGYLIAEYADGKKMIVEDINGQLIETREYHA